MMLLLLHSNIIIIIISLLSLFLNSPKYEGKNHSVLDMCISKQNYRNLLAFGSVFCLILSVVIYQRERFVDSRYTSRDKAKQATYAVIGILSARDNFKERQAARDTWLKYLTERDLSNKRLTYKFIVGSEGCKVPLEDRQDVYSCEWKPMPLTYPDEEILAYSIPINGNVEKANGLIALDFEVMYPIVIKWLGIIAVQNGNNQQQRLRVSIFDRISKVEIVYAEFHSNVSTIAANNFLFQNVDHYMLPKGFKGSLVVDGSSNEFDVMKISGPCLLNDGGGLISFHRITRHGVISSYFPEELVLRDTFCHFLPGTFVYSAFFKRNQSSESLVKARLRRYESHLNELLTQSSRLEKEAAQYKDILFVQVVDYYRNLPKKLLEFYSWVVETYQFKFTMKTDDDCFLNIPAIIKATKEHKLEMKENVWYSQFRYNWQIDSFGKWAESVYTSIVYPAFGCGSGNMLSYNLVKWIAQNKLNLHSFQGEDVSVGIWLSALAPLIVNDRRWSCIKSCHKNMLSLPDNNPLEMKALYDNEVRCGDPCTCDI